MLKRFLSMLCMPIAMVMQAEAAENTQFYYIPQKYLDQQERILSLLQVTIEEFYNLRTNLESNQMINNQLTYDLAEKIAKIFQYESEDHRIYTGEEMKSWYPTPKQGTPNWLPKSIQGTVNENSNN